MFLLRNEFNLGGKLRATLWCGFFISFERVSGSGVGSRNTAIDDREAAI